VSGAPWPAPAKLNLFLHVVGRRPDGYHELQTVFQLIDLADELEFELRDDGRLRRLAGPAEVEPDHDLSLRAARLLQASTGTPLGADIRVHKRIPVGGGLGGGSSDAATTLVALNALWGTGLSPTQLPRWALASAPTCRCSYTVTAPGPKGSANA
jgi:4-diphosphocytidyl-2-C-methyl-D-erythritol kinase